MPMAFPIFPQLIPLSLWVMLLAPPPLTGQVELNPHLIRPSVPFVCLIFCHCPEANRSLGQWSCLVFGTVSFPGHLYAHL